MKKFDEVNLLFGQKGNSLCKNFFSIFQRFPNLFSKHYLKELAFFLSNTSESFLDNHSVFILRKILFSFYRFVKKESLSPNQNVCLKILEIQSSIYGIFIALYHPESEFNFNEERILKGVQWLIPAVKPIAKSHLTFKKERSQFFYLEVVKMRGGFFSNEEKRKLIKELPKVLQKELEPRALSLPGNDEELFKKIQNLSQELRAAHDLPQVLISFVEYFQRKLKFLVIAVRFSKPRSPSILSLSQKLSPSVSFSLENLFCLQKVGKKYVKEAAIFTLEVSNAPFLRSGSFPDLRVARQYVVKELENMLGSFRDYNGGLICKEDEQIVLLKEILEKKRLSFPLLEDFFYNIKPTFLRALLLPETATALAELFLEIESNVFPPSQNYLIKSHFSFQSHVILIKTTNKELKNTISNGILGHFSQTGFSSSLHEGFFYLVFFQQAPRDQSLLELVHKNLAPNAHTPFKQKESILRINFQVGDPPTLNPRLAHDINCHILSNLLFEGLTKINQQNRITPAAAEKIVLSSCGCHYTFHLRNSYWSNGKAVTAHHFVRAWQKAILAESDSRMYLNFFLPIKNAKKVIAEGASIKCIGFVAKDDKTLCVELESPCSHFLNLLASPPFFPLYGESEEPVDFNGPFAVSEWKRDRMLYLSKNPFYRNASQIQLRGIKISLIRDAYEVYQMFQRGELDLIGDPISPLPLEILKEPSFQKKIQSKKVSRIYWIHCNMDAFPFQNVHVRQALSLAINRELLTKKVFINQVPHASPLPSKYSCLSANLQGAKEEANRHFEKALNELGLSRATFPPLTFTHSDLSYERPLFEELRSQWKNTLGIETIATQLTWSEFSSALEKKKFQMAGLFRRDYYSNPLFYLSFFKTSPFNPHSWENAEYEKLLKQCSLKNPHKEIRNMENFLVKEVPVIPLVNQNYLFLIHKRVKGIKFQDNGCLNLMEVSLNEND